MTFSEIILTLQNYWREQGCVILQPYDMPAGAGTYHQATFLRSLGPKPWATAYVAPSRRPTDGRYGENPNRLGAYYQFQVLIKPSPENIQELYLKSLEKLGLNLKNHDIRFVEDNWESPTLGAWGMQLASLSVGTFAVIVVDAVGDIAGLLYLSDEASRADGMHASDRQEKNVARCHVVTLKHLHNTVVFDSSHVFIRIDGLRKAAIQRSVGGSLDYVPHLRFSE